MRPIILTMQAFGPYAQTEVIDFREIDGQQMFVISGKTGSGKTTIFDAISFALFGKANNSQREAKSLRSQFTTNDLVTEVILEFQLRGKHYRISRQPQQELLKKNGEGTRVVPATAALYQLVNGEEELLAGTVNDTDSKIAELIQLNVEQFRQILMIPQGEFRELLLASSKEKQIILQKLANTIMYKKVEDLLRQKQTEKLTELQYLSQELESRTQKIQENLAFEGKTVDEIITAMLNEIIQKQEYIVKSEQELSIQTIRIENATKDAAFAETTLKEWDKLASIQQKLDTLADQRSNYQDKQRAIDINKKAAGIRPVELICQNLTKQRDEFQQESEAYKHAVSASNILFQETKAQRSELLEQQESENNRQKQLTNLEIIEDKMKRLSQEKQLLQQMKTEFLELETKQQETLLQQEKLRSSKDDAEFLRQELQQAMLTKREQELLLTEQQNKEQEIIKYIENMTKLQHNQQQLQELQQKHDNITRTEFDAEQRLHELQHNMHQQQAAILAIQVKDGLPCPVCGSTEHPVLATFEGEINTEEIMLLETEFKKMQMKKAEIESQMSRLEGAAVEINVPQDVDLPDLQALLTDTQKTIDEYQQALTDLTKQTLVMEQNDNNLMWTTKELNNITISLQEMELKLSSLRAPMQQRQALVDMLEKEIPTRYENSEVFFNELTQLKNESQIFNDKLTNVEAKFQQTRDTVRENEVAYNTTLRNFQKAEEELAKEMNTLEKMIHQADFKTLAEYQQAVLSDEQLQAFETEIAKFEQEVFHNSQVLQELEQKLEGSTKPDLTELQARLTELTSKRTEMEQQTSLFKEELQQLQLSMNELEAINQKYLQHEVAYRDLGELADTALGKNERNLGFERFVLGTFLDMILQRANVRLVKMTGGRFTLHRKHEKAKYNAQSGLDLMIFDEYTGKVRDVSSLSGGESFKTSLALALSLAEIVQELSGGISLETMFIDEGFGTLDADSLDNAIETLLETQAAGRLVGIISHVPELKERIGVRLEVTATNYGSTTQFIK